MVECGGLENRCRLIPTGGSNPSLSAIAVLAAAISMKILEYRLMRRSIVCPDFAAPLSARIFDGCRTYYIRPPCSDSVFFSLKEALNKSIHGFIQSTQGENAISTWLQNQ